MSIRLVSLLLLVANMSIAQQKIFTEDELLAVVKSYHP